MLNRRFALSFALLLSVAGFATPSSAQILPVQSGISGNVYYDSCSGLPKGTVCILGLQPLSTRLYIVSHLADGTRMAAQIKSDARGAFKVTLAPGTYSIQVDPLVSKKLTVVNGRAFTVTSGRYTVLDLLAYNYRY